MRSVIKVYNLNTSKDLGKIQNAISNNEGVIACEISLTKKEIQVIYNETIVNLDKLIECIENLGYMVN